MNLQISYYKSGDILLLQNGQRWGCGSNVAKNLVAYADGDREIVGIEVSGAVVLLSKTLYGKREITGRAVPVEFPARPDEADLDRVSLPLSVNYDPEMDELVLESGLPTPFEQTIADGLTAFYDGEDEYGKYINAVRIENAGKLLKPYLAL